LKEGPHLAWLRWKDFNLLSIEVVRVEAPIVQYSDNCPGGKFTANSVAFLVKRL